MATRKRTVLASAVLVLLVGGIVVACGSTEAELPSIPDASPTPTPTQPAPQAEAGADADAGPPVLPPVEPPAPPKQDEVTEAFGIFVSKGAPDGGDGTRAKPYNTIAEGLEFAEKAKKRLYVCTGTYPEAVVLRNGVSIVANLVCVDPTKWVLGTSRTTIASPTSPAVVADKIVAPTRVDGLDIIAPPGTADSPSSIGLLATNSTQLTFTEGKIETGNAADGIDGRIPDPFIFTVTRAPGTGSAASDCRGASGGYCSTNPGTLTLGARPEIPAAVGGEGKCSVRNIGDLLSSGGGGGGRGAAYYPDNPRSLMFPAAAGGTGTIGATPPQPVGGASSTGGQFTERGYDPGNGQDGTHVVTMSAGGVGGAGGTTPPPVVVDAPRTRFAESGGGGGAGGCPGRLGTGGSGGGASVGAILIKSPVRFEKVSIQTGNGGKGGVGNFGTPPTAGQSGGAGLNSGAGAAGAPGVQAGASGHGAGGPSIAIAHDSLGPPAIVDSPLSHGTAGASPAEVTTPGTFPGQPARTILAPPPAKAQKTLQF